MRKYHNNTSGSRESTMNPTDLLIKLGFELKHSNFKIKIPLNNVIWYDHIKGDIVLDSKSIKTSCDTTC